MLKYVKTCITKCIIFLFFLEYSKFYKFLIIFEISYSSKYINLHNLFFAYDNIRVHRDSNNEAEFFFIEYHESYYLLLLHFNEQYFYFSIKT